MDSRLHFPATRLRLSAQAFLLAICLGSFAFECNAFICVSGLTQESFPAPPADRTLVYVSNASNALEPLPFESGTTPLKQDVVAGKNKTSYVEVAGPNASKTIENPLTRFYLFVADESNPHPPFIVRLTQKGGARRVTAMAQKGLKGFAIDSEEIVKPHYRVLSRADGTLYMEISPRESLAPGEYAIIGADLRRIATFRITPASQQ